MKRHFAILLLICMSFTRVSAQPAYAPSIQKEALGRGLVAIRQDESHVAVTWRLLAGDAPGTAFQVWRDGQLITKKPLNGATYFVDDYTGTAATTYEVRPVGKTKGTRTADGGIFTLPAEAPAGYIHIPLDKPAGGTTPTGDRFDYTANDASVGDVDGDGEYEIILKWEPTNAHDNAHDGYTGNVLFDCYRLSGERLWRIDLGPNIRAGAHYTQFMVFDLDGDNRAEVVMKTADGTIDGRGAVIGDPFADYRYKGDVMSHADEIRQDSIDEANMRAREQQMRQWFTQDSLRRIREGEKPLENPFVQRGNANRRGQGAGGQAGFGGPRKRTPSRQGRILTGDEFLTVFSGLTGEALHTIPYVPARGELADWGDTNANRSERYLACVAYLDGQHPSVVMCRGYYTRAVLAAFDWDGRELRQRWVFDSSAEGNGDYSGQGNHNLRVADVDGDGCDEIIYGSCAIDHDGTGLYTTGLGHGDAMHLTGFIPGDRKLQVWQCHETKGNGSTLRDAATGEVLFQIRAREDVGRCMAADIDPTNPGVEMWSSESGGIRNYCGEVVREHVRGLSTNMAIWWDGDLLRELLDGTRISKYDWQEGTCDVIFDPEGVTRNNGTKSNPCLQADIVGDWREEILVRTSDNCALRLYVTPTPTDHRFVTFMNDIPYRLSVATQNVAYNQPTQPGFYFGPDKQ